MSPELQKRAEVFENLSSGEGSEARLRTTLARDPPEDPTPNANVEEKQISFQVRFHIS
jgi:hypothetical protein